MMDEDLTIPDCLNRKLHPREYTPEELRIIARHKRASSGLVWPTQKQIDKAIRKREREKREDAASKIELGSMRIKRGQ
jgi:hypothetical protein